MSFAKKMNEAMEKCNGDFGDLRYAAQHGDLKVDYQPLMDAVGKISFVQTDRIGSDYDTLQVVLKLDDHDAYVACDGSYSSYDGTDYDYAEFYDVEPKQTTIYV